MSAFGRTVNVIDKLQSLIEGKVSELCYMRSHDFALCYHYIRALHCVLLQCIINPVDVYQARFTTNAEFSRYLIRLMDDVRFCCMQGAQSSGFTVYIGGKPIKSIQDIVDLLEACADCFLLLAISESLKEGFTKNDCIYENLDILLSTRDNPTACAYLYELMDEFNNIPLAQGLSAELGFELPNCIPASGSRLYRVLFERLPSIACGKKDGSPTVRQERVSKLLDFIDSHCVEFCEVTFPALIKFIYHHLVQGFMDCFQGKVRNYRLVPETAPAENRGDSPAPISEFAPVLSRARGWSKLEDKILVEAIQQYDTRWRDVVEHLRSNKIYKSYQAITRRGRRVAKLVRLAYQHPEQDNNKRGCTPSAFIYIPSEDTFQITSSLPQHIPKWDFEPIITEDTLLLDYISIPMEPQHLTRLMGVTCTIPVRYPFSRDPTSSDHTFVLVATSGGARAEVDMSGIPNFKQDFINKLWEIEKIRVYANEHPPGASFQSRICVKNSQSIATETLSAILVALGVKWLKYTSYGTKMNVKVAYEAYNPVLESMHVFRHENRTISLPSNVFDISVNQRAGIVKDSCVPIFLGFPGAMPNRHGTVSVHEQFDQLVDQDAGTPGGTARFLFGGIQARFNTSSPIGSHTRTIYSTISHTLKKATQLTYKVPKSILGAKRILMSVKRLLNCVQKDVGVRKHGYRVEVRLSANDLKEAVSMCIKHNLLYVRTLFRDCGWEDMYEDFCWNSPSAGLLLEPRAPVPLVAVPIPTIVRRARQLIADIISHGTLKKRESKKITRFIAQDFVDLYNAIGFHSTTWRYGRIKLSPTRMCKVMQQLVTKNVYAYHGVYLSSSELSGRFRVSKFNRSFQ